MIGYEPAYSAFSVIYLEMLPIVSVRQIRFLFPGLLDVIVLLEM